MKTRGGRMTERENENVAWEVLGYRKGVLWNAVFSPPLDYERVGKKNNLPWLLSEYGSFVLLRNFCSLIRRHDKTRWRMYRVIRYAHCAGLWGSSVVKRCGHFIVTESTKKVIIFIWNMWSTPWQQKHGVRACMKQIVHSSWLFWDHSTALLLLLDCEQLASLRPSSNYWYYWTVNGWPAWHHP